MIMFTEIIDMWTSVTPWDQEQRKEVLEIGNSMLFL
jgi:hypothetical protein